MSVAQFTSLGSSQEDIAQTLSETNEGREVAVEHESAAAPVADDMPPALQTIGGDDASRWAAWIPASAGVLDASKRATPWDHAQVLLSKSMSSLRSHVPEHTQLKEESSENSAEEVAEGTSVDYTQVDGHATSDEPHMQPTVAKWYEMAHKVRAAAELEAEGARGETRMHPQLAKWRELVDKVNEIVHKASTVETITRESIVAAPTTVPALELLAATEHDSSVQHHVHFGATLEAITLESSADTGMQATTGSDKAANEALIEHGSHLDETSDDAADLLDHAQVLWSQSVCALRSSVTGLLQVAEGMSGSPPDLEEDAPQAATAIVETEGSAEAPNENVDEALERTSAPETESTSAPKADFEQVFETATRLDHAQVFLSLSLAALRSGVSRIHGPNGVTVQ